MALAPLPNLADYHRPREHRAQFGINVPSPHSGRKTNMPAITAVAVADQARRQQKSYRFSPPARGAFRGQSATERKRMSRRRRCRDAGSATSIVYNRRTVGVPVDTSAAHAPLSLGASGKAEAAPVRPARGREPRNGRCCRAARRSYTPHAGPRAASVGQAPTTRPQSSAAGRRKPIS